MLDLYLFCNVVDENCFNGGKEWCDFIEFYCLVSDYNKE